MIMIISLLLGKKQDLSNHIAFHNCCFAGLVQLELSLLFQLESSFTLSNTVLAFSIRSTCSKFSRVKILE